MDFFLKWKSFISKNTVLTTIACLVFALIIAITNVIPYLGSWIGTSLPVLYVLLTSYNKAIVDMLANGDSFVLSDKYYLSMDLCISSFDFSWIMKYSRKINFSAFSSSSSILSHFDSPYGRYSVYVPEYGGQ